MNGAVSQFISISDPADGKELKLHFLTGPDRTGETEPVLFLHGLAANRKAFSPSFEHLSMDRFVPIVLELPGHGRSDARPNNCRPEWYRDVVLSFLSKRDLQISHVVGHSMGGTIALLVVEERDENPPFLCVEGLPRKLSFLQKRLERWEDNTSPEDGFRKVLEEFERSDNPGIKQWISWARECDPATFFQSCRTFLDLWDRENMLERFRRYPADRRLYLCGQHSHYAYISDHLSPGAYTCIGDAGHFPMAEKPDDFWQAVRDFLE